MDRKYEPAEIEKKWPSFAKASDGQAGRYNHREIEHKWQEVWEKEKLYLTPKPDAEHPKRYILDMFPYPSGAGLHVGHMEGYVATDVIVRYLRMKGLSVLHPMGWDAFGLPAENYAIKEGIAPDKSTHENIKNFKYQLQLLGLSYDWSKEIDTSSPKYYKWTQWLFTLLFKKGLAYKKKAPANWCPKDETVLANEQVVDGKCERCGTAVVQKELEQWFFKITDYADKLISGLDKVDWPESTKTQQVNWIGKKEGIEITYEVVGVPDEITVFTTAPVNFGMTFLVLGPEHHFVQKIISGEIKISSETQKEVKDYVEAAGKKTELERIAAGREKTGVFTTLYAINSINGKKVPIYVTDFVLGHVGTGAVQGCPAHDLKDFQFAKKFNLPIVRVVEGPDGDAGPVEREDQIIEKGMRGTFINSEFLNGLSFEGGLQKTMDYFVEKGVGRRVVTYHIRDWLISRQRYWGCPIPMVFCEKDSWQPVPDSELPILLPTDIDFRPTGESPIARSGSFQKGVRCPVCGEAAKREVDTMDTYVDSSWYFYRFVDPDNNKKFASKKALETWMPVDIYVGGGHVVQHLLFARFFHKVLVDAGYIKGDGAGEPFLKLRAPGWILGPDSRKMSKRWANVITPEEVVAKHGADTMRMYEMFMAPFEVDKPWNVNSVAGVQRFLSRIYGLFERSYQLKDAVAGEAMAREINKLVFKVGKDIEGFKFNTAVAAMMEFVNQVQSGLKTKEQGEGSYTWRVVWEKFLTVLAPFAPHLAEELWSHFAKASRDKHGYVSVHQQSWPEVDEKYLGQESRTIVVSINGKARATLKMSNGQSSMSNSQEEVEKLARGDQNVAKWLEGKEVKKVVYVPGKIVNFVV